jgi:hypothetical protein
MTKVKCVDCYWFEPSDDGRRGFCLFLPPLAVPHPVQVPPSPITRPAGPGAPQMAMGATGVHTPVQSDGRCHHFSVSGDPNEPA